MSNKTPTTARERCTANLAIIWFRFKCVVAFGVAITTTIGGYGLGAEFPQDEVIGGCLLGFSVYLVICGATALVFEGIEFRVQREIEGALANDRSTR